MRIVSLLPSATETLCLLGGADMLVGRSHECDFPRGLGHLPVLTAPRTAAGDPADIDQQVRESLKAGEPLYTLDESLLARLKPDVILTQDLCRVCSIDLGAVRRVAARLTPSPAVVSLNPTSIEAVLDDLYTVGNAAGLHEKARTKAVRLRERLFRAADCVNPYDDGPVVGFLEWTDPLFVAGHWTVQLIERAGGRHPLNPTSGALHPAPSPRGAGLRPAPFPSGAGHRPAPPPPSPTGEVPAQRAEGGAAPQGAWHTLRTPQSTSTAGPSIAVPEEVFAASAPEYLVICRCGVGLDEAERAARAIAGKPWFRDLPAARVAVVDGNQMFNRPGPRLVDAFEWLVGWLNDRAEVIPEGFPWKLL